MGSETLPSTCYIFFPEYNIPCHSTSNELTIQIKFSVMFWPILMVKDVLLLLSSPLFKGAFMQEN